MASHVLVVDDDLDLCSELSEYLASNDFRVTVVNSAKQMLETLAREAIDLLLLEPRLHGEDGVRVTRAARASSNTPIVVLSQNYEVADRVMGLELGADDYLTKPFSTRELLARIRAVLRRYAQQFIAPAADDALRAYRFAGWELNLRLLRLICPAGNRVDLSRSELNLLRAFLAAPRRVLTREHLLDATHIDNLDINERSIDVQVQRLRRKLEADPAGPRFILTERGIGYCFDASVSVVR